MFNKKLKEEIKELEQKIEENNTYGYKRGDYSYDYYQDINKISIKEKISSLEMQLIRINDNLTHKINKQQALLNELIDYVYSKEEK